MSPGAGPLGTVVLTGATSSIGEAAARRLASRATRLVLLGPEPPDDVADVLAGVRRGGPAEVHYVAADFTRLREVVAAARRVRAVAPRIDLLVHDAAVPGSPERVLTEDGSERTLQVDALAPALLTRLLVPALHPGSRVVAVASSAHRVEPLDLDDPDLVRGYAPVTAYARAKGAMLAWALALADELRPSGVDVVAVCPGLNATALSAALAGPVGGSPDRGARRVLHAATADVPSGSYLEDDRVVPPAGDVTSAATRERLAALLWARLRPF
ncbi:SDR family NAD(P)-dependent oxidoreductase [Cellulomonas sp. P4]|uniref:SDR family NAD(P)-dependent oxidoreductase n=1 Tax=Cellulomonas sp. P4 TaxID=3142533 RepID=UPI0031BA1192